MRGGQTGPLVELDHVPAGAVVLVPEQAERGRHDRAGRPHDEADRGGVRQLRPAADELPRFQQRRQGHQGDREVRHGRVEPAEQAKERRTGAGKQEHDVGVVESVPPSCGCRHYLAGLSLSTG